jgi:hypothetical protein
MSSSESFVGETMMLINSHRYLSIKKPQFYANDPLVLSFDENVHVCELVSSGQEHFIVNKSMHTRRH